MLALRGIELCAALGIIVVGLVLLTACVASERMFLMWRGRQAALRYASAQELHRWPDRQACYARFDGRSRLQALPSVIV
jgi:hypothetical protein